MTNTVPAAPEASPTLHEHGNPEAISAGKNDPSRHNRGAAVRADTAQVEPVEGYPSVEEVADALTGESLYDPNSLQELNSGEAPFAPGDMVERASSMVRALEETTYESGIDNEVQQKIDNIFTQETVDQEELKELGIDTEYTKGLNNLLAALIHGRPPIDIETVGPYACEHLDEQGRLTVDEEKIPNDEMIGIELAAMFRNLADSSGSPVRIVSLLDELNNYIEGDIGNRRLTPEEQDKYVVVMAEYFEQKGIIKSEDQMGGQVLLLRESEQQRNVPKLIEELEQSGKGEVVTETTEEGKEVVRFIPDDELVDDLGLKSKNRRKELRRKGILLKEDDTYTCQALDASAFLGEENKGIIHLVMLDHNMSSQQDKVYALLKSIDVVESDRYHNIFTDSEKVDPQTAVYTVAKYLISQLEHFIKNEEEQG